MHKCKNPECSNLTDNPKFCSQSCAAVVNNGKFPKRIRQKFFCKICGIEIPSRRIYCDRHNPQIIDWSKVTIENVLDSHSGLSNSRYGRIRDNAKRIYEKSARPEKCEYCSYSKHYEVCHIKPIHLFSKDTVVSVVNDIDNLVALCSNCHWELDHGLLRL